MSVGNDSRNQRRSRPTIGQFFEKSAKIHTQHRNRASQDDSNEDGWTKVQRRGGEKINSSRKIHARTAPVSTRNRWVSFKDSESNQHQEVDISTLPTGPRPVEVGIPQKQENHWANAVGRKVRFKDMPIRESKIVPKAAPKTAQKSVPKTAPTSTSVCSDLFADFSGDWADEAEKTPSSMDVSETPDWATSGYDAKPLSERLADLEKSTGWSDDEETPVEENKAVVFGTENW